MAWPSPGGGLVTEVNAPRRSPFRGGQHSISKHSFAASSRRSGRSRASISRRGIAIAATTAPASPHSPNWRTRASASPSSPPMRCSITPLTGAPCKTCSPASARNARLPRRGSGSKPMPSGISSRRNDMARLFSGHEDALQPQRRDRRRLRLLPRRVEIRISRRAGARGQDPAIPSRRFDLGGRGLALSPRRPRQGARHACEGTRADRRARLRAPISSPSTTSSAMRGAAASSARAAARPPTPRSATASPSPMSIPPRSIFCSSASSRPSAKSRPTSTSISSTSGARR